MKSYNNSHNNDNKIIFHNLIYHTSKFTITIINVLLLLFVLPTVSLAEHGNLMEINQITPDLKLPEINVSWSAKSISFTFILILFVILFYF